MSYPKWVSRGFGLGEILCLNEDEENAVVNADDDAEAAAAEEVVHTVAALRAKLDAAGIAYDNRWGVKKLQAALPQE